MNPWFWVTQVGAPELWLGIAAGVLIFYLARRKVMGKKGKGFAKVFILSLILTLVTVQAVKDVAQVPRPCGIENPYCEDDFSFPSGHSAAAFVAFSSILLFLPRKWLPLLVIPVLVAYSRVALGVHTVTDVVAGSILGIMFPVIVWEALRKKGRI
ncbi:MAG: phosphatase PAP2 family protein [Candidatus Aenigmarchaeota archaeon]|nr:phosphatase PAP2 family protein [Candidatus Aenigmarchaeota archaeon]